MNPSSLFQRARAWLADLTVGGAWGRTLASSRQFNLRWYWFDGLFAAASDNIILNFVSLYIIALGATGAQVGLASSLSSIASALVLFPGAFLAERALHKKRVPLAFGAAGRFAIFLLVFVPILFDGPTAIWIAIALSVTRDACTYFGYPAWMDITNDVVPIEGRGRYFGSRNFIMGIAGMAVTLLTGKLITLFVHTTGYQIAMAAAFVLGMTSTFCFSRIEEGVSRRAAVLQKGFPLRSLLSMLKGKTNFIALAVTAAMWNFAVNISGPFFNVQMVNVLHFSTAVIGVLNVISAFTSLITQKRIGGLADRFSNRKLQLISMALIPLLPAAWIFVTASWQVALINLVNGVFWGTYNLVSFNLFLAAVPRDQVARFTAVYQVVILVAMALGSALGSAIVAAWGFTGVLIATVTVRYITVAVFARFVRDPQMKPAD
jgi:MFS family permease